MRAIIAGFVRRRPTSWTTGAACLAAAFTLAANAGLLLLSDSSAASNFAAEHFRANAS